jgi:surface protein
MKKKNNNRDEKIEIKNKIFLKIENYFFQILILFGLIFSISSNNYINDNRILEEESQIIEIIANINETGEIGIFNTKFTNLPNYVYVNESITNISINNTIMLEPSLYLIKLVWDKQLSNCDSLFSGLSNIIQIDLENFNTSKVISMRKMFKKCRDLKNIIFGNKFDTSSCKQKARNVF